MRYTLAVDSSRGADSSREKEVYSIMVDNISDTEFKCLVFTNATEKLGEFISNNYDDAKQAGLDFVDENFGVVTNIEEDEFDNP